MIQAALFPTSPAELGVVDRAEIRRRLDALQRTAGTQGQGSIVAGHLAANSVTAAAIAAGTITASLIAAGAITATQIAAGTITGDRIAANTITATNIAANTITAGQIAADTITAGQIAANAITSSELAANSITAGDMLANTITAAQIAAGTITTVEIAANTIVAGDIAAGTITGDRIVVGTLTGDLLASATIAGDRLIADTITSREVVGSTLSAVFADMGTLTAGKVLIGTAGAAKVGIGQGFSTTAGTKDGLIGTDAGNAITFWLDPSTGNLQLKGTILSGSSGLGNISGTVGTAQIAADAVTAGPLADNLFSSQALVNQFFASGVVNADRIVAASITASQIASATITATQIAANTITAAKIAAGTITATEIAAGTITADRMNVTQLSAITANMGAITAGTITGGTIRTAASGARVEHASTGIDAYNATEKVFNLSSANGGVSLLTGVSTAPGSQALLNPSFAVDASNWTAVGGGIGIIRVTGAGVFHSGTSGGSITGLGTGDPTKYVEGAATGTFDAGKTYEIEFFYKPAPSGETGQDSEIRFGAIAAGDYATGYVRFDSAQSGFARAALLWTPSAQRTTGVVFRHYAPALIANGIYIDTFTIRDVTVPTDRQVRILQAVTAGQPVGSIFGYRGAGQDNARTVLQSLPLSTEAVLPSELTLEVTTRDTAKRLVNLSLYQNPDANIVAGRRAIWAEVRNDADTAAIRKKVIDSAGASDFTLTDATNLGGATGAARALRLLPATHITAAESRTNVAFGVMTTPDRVSGITCPANSILVVNYWARFQNSVAGAGSATVVLNGTRVKVHDGGVAGGQADNISNSPGAAAVYNVLATTANNGVRVRSSGFGVNAPPATGMGMGQDITDSAGGPFYIIVPNALSNATLEIQFKSTSGSITVADRHLMVGVMAPV